jgi:WD40 repeat protein
MRLFFPLSGDDVFISYSRRDGALYAAGLADKLTEKKLSCFIDKLGTEPNHDLPPSLKKKIKNCTVFVLVGTEKATQSEFVKKEIAEFKQTGRTILPIDFGGNVANAIWYEEIPGLAVETEKDSEALETGNPSQNVTNFVEKSFNYTRRNQFMSRMFWGALSVFFILIGLGVGSYIIANNKANEASMLANTKTRDAELATNKANEASNLANREKTRADQESNRAKEQEQNANIATNKANAAQKLADEKNQLALAKTKLAVEKTELANKAEIRASNAVIQANQAEALAKAAEKKEELANAEAKKQQRAAIGNRLIAESNLETNSYLENADEKILLNIEGMRMSQVPEAYRNLLEGNKLLPLPTTPKTYTDGNIQILTFSLNGKFMAVGIDKKLFVENAADLFSKEKNSSSQPLIHNSSIKQAEFSPDSEYLVTASGKKLRIWKTDLMKEVTSVINSENDITSLAFSSNGKYLAVGFQVDETNETPKISAKILDVQKNYQVCASVYTRQSVADFSFSLDEKQFTTIEDEGIKVWNVIGENQKQPVSSKENVGINVSKGGFTLNNKYLFAVSSDEGTWMNIWKNDKEQKNYFRQFTQLRDFEFSPKGRFLVAAKVDTDTGYKSADLIELADEDLKVTKQFPYRSMFRKSAFSQDDNYLALSTDKKITQIYETFTGRLIGFIKHEKPVAILAFAPDKKHIVASEENTIKIWSLNDSYFESSATNHATTYEKIIISPDGKYIVHPDENKLVFENALKGKITEPIPKPLINNCPIEGVVYNAAGDRLALSGSCGISIWETSDGEHYNLSKLVKTEFSQMKVLALSSSGKWVMAVNDSNVYIYDTYNPKSVIPLLQNSNESDIESAAFSPNEKFVALAEQFGYLEQYKIRIWNIQKQKEYDPLPYPRFFIPDFNKISVAFDSNNGNLLANDNYNAYIWNVTENVETQQLKFQEIGQLPLKSETDNSASETTISANGKFLVTKNYIIPSENRTTVFKWLPEDLIESVCQRLGKVTFTENEWKEKIGNEPYNQTCVDSPNLLPSLIFVK